MTRPLDIVFLGLSLSSSWGNGHATTFRALLRGLHAAGCRVTFLERDVPWYAGHRDLPAPDFCEFHLYSGVGSLIEDFGDRLATADAVIVGSYLPDGVEVIDAIAEIDPQRLCFYDIDTPITLAKLRRSEEEYIACRQVGLFDLYFSFSGGHVLTTLESELGAREARALFCSVDHARYHHTGDAIEWDLGYLGTYSADRQPGLERFLLAPARRLPDMRFVVAGPQFPDDIEWPDNVERIEHVAPEDHARFYTRQRFTLNLTRADMVAAGWSPSVRLFEAAACGVPIISDDWPGLSELLPGGVITAAKTEDVMEALVSLADARRSEIAAAARRTVIAAHSGEARARELLTALNGIPPHRTTASVKEKTHARPHA